MDFIELAKHRFSARSYEDIPVETEKLNYILEAARIAPSAANKQPVIIHVIKKGTIRNQINGTYPRDWIKEAPVLLVISADHQQAWKHPQTQKDAGYIDASIVIDHMTLAASQVGLATCWICNFDVKKCAEILGIKKNIEPVALLPVGYSNEKPDINRHRKARKNISEIVVNIHN